MGFNSVSFGFLGGGGSGGGGGSVPLNGITAATGPNSIDNGGDGNYQIWDWSTFTGIGPALQIRSTSNILNGTAFSAALFSVALFGNTAKSNIVSCAAEFTNQSASSGGNLTNIAAVFSATGAANNYAAVFTNGYVGIGTSTPLGLFDVQGLANARLYLNDTDKWFTAYFNGGDDQIYLDGTNHIFRIYTNDNQVFTQSSDGFIFQNGNVGINNPAPSVALDVFGNVKVFSNAGDGLFTGSAVSKVGDWNNAVGGNILAVDDGNNLAYYDNTAHTGLFGINTSTPSVALDVVGDVQSADGNVNLGKQTGVYTSLIHTEGGNVVSLGDWNGEVNNTYLSVDDPNSKIVLTNNIQFSSYGAGAIVADGSGNLTSTSDRRAKHNIKPFTMGTRELMKLQSSTFIYNKDSTNTVMPGFIAQDVEKAFGGVGIGHDKAGMLSLNTNVVLAALTNGFKEQEAKIHEQQKQIEALKKIIEMNLL